MNILDTIVKRKKEEIAERKANTSVSVLEQRIAFSRPCHSLSGFITDPNKSGIIAEFKKKSPSRPNINLDANAVKITSGYERAGASACSILTDIDFFGGSDFDLVSAREVLHIPVLRKDFVVDPYQIIEAKSLGADAILLIAEILTKQEIEDLSSVAVSLGLEVLMEIHTGEQLEKYHDNIRNIGVNNRNLKTFTTDIQYSIELYPHLPSDTVKVSESGISDANIVVELMKVGYQGFLIGENFMKTADPGQSAADFVAAIKSLL